MRDVCYSSAPSSSLPFQQAQGLGRQGLAPGTGSILDLTRVLFTQYALPLPYSFTPDLRHVKLTIECNAKDTSFTIYEYIFAAVVYVGCVVFGVVLFITITTRGGGSTGIGIGALAILFLMASIVPVGCGLGCVQFVMNDALVEAEPDGEQLTLVDAHGELQPQSSGAEEKVQTAAAAASPGVCDAAATHFLKMCCGFADVDLEVDTTVHSPAPPAVTTTGAVEMVETAAAAAAAAVDTTVLVVSPALPTVTTTTTHQVQVPVGIVAGMPFQVQVGQQLITIACPPGVAAGAMIQIQVRYSCLMLSF